MIALIATLGLTLLALALLGGIAFVVRGPSSVRRANTLPDRPFVPTEIDAPLHAFGSISVVDQLRELPALEPVDMDAPIDFGP